MSLWFCFQKNCLHPGVGNTFEPDWGLLLTPLGEYFWTYFVFNGEYFWTLTHYNKTALKERSRHLRKAMTFCEKIVWTHLRKRKLKVRFLRQYSSDNYIIDFYCPEIKLAIEIDGDVHNLPKQKEYDLARQKFLENFGVRFIRITNEELIGNPDKAFKKIERGIESLFPEAKM